MVLNNVTKFHKILIKSTRLREQTLFKTVNFHKQMAFFSFFSSNGHFVLRTRTICAILVEDIMGKIPVKLYERQTK